MIAESAFFSSLVAIGGEHRQWGRYEVLAEGPGYKVKSLFVEPGRATSLQLHRERSEVWQLVEGDVLVEIEDSMSGDMRPVRLRSVGGTAIVPIGKKHRIRNDGDKPATIIEVQIGRCREDDIERFAP